MGLMEYVWRKTSKTEKEPEERADDQLLSFLMGQAVGDTIDRGCVESIPAVKGCLSFVAGAVSMMPVRLYREQDGKVIEVRTDRRLKLLNDETGDTLNASQFWRAVVSDYYLSGSAYVYINRPGLETASLHYVDSGAVSIQKNADNIFKRYFLYVDGVQYWPHNFIKILRDTKDGAKGTSIVSQSNEMLSVAYHTILFERALMKSGGNKKGVIKSTNTLDPTAIELLKESYKRVYGNNNDNVLILNNGLDFMQLSNTSVEMQLYENKKQNIEQICMLFQVPQKVIEGTCSDDEYISAIKTAVMPLVKDIECALNRDLLLESEKEKGYFFVVDPSELLKADIRKRFEAYKVALDANFMQIDEVRYKENMEPLDINFLKLGLNDVLMDPKTKAVYTPNTGQTVTLGGGEKIED